ncbi:hypothetical protein [Actinoplanes sp. NPDC049802]|uniref:hypothetical protein n=1 Tax=Actinoplanes sp. NPDC049802 TaxID=3154742 RepID=UPI0033E69680
MATLYWRRQGCASFDDGASPKLRSDHPVTQRQHSTDADGQRGTHDLLEESATAATGPLAENVFVRQPGQQAIRIDWG